MPGVWEPSYIVVIGILSVAVILDMKSRKVDNRFIVSSLVISILGILVFSGLHGFIPGLASFATAFILGLPIYMLRIFGGGDFKLLLAISPLLDWKAIVFTTVASFVWGGVLGLFQVILQKDLKTVGMNLQAMFLARQRPAENNLHRMPYTVAILVAFLSFLTAKQVGWELL